MLTRRRRRRRRMRMRRRREEEEERNVKVAPVTHPRCASSRLPSSEPRPEPTAKVFWVRLLGIKPTHTHTRAHAHTHTHTHTAVCVSAAGSSFLV